MVCRVRLELTTPRLKGGRYATSASGALFTQPDIFVDYWCGKQESNLLLIYSRYVLSEPTFEKSRRKFIEPTFENIQPYLS